MALIDPPRESRTDRDWTLASGRSENTETDGIGVSLDVVFEVLKNRRRRWILAYLERTAGPTHIRELAEELAARENETSVAALTSTERKRTYVALYQTHLPKLDDLGVIEYDRRSGSVESTERTAAVLSIAERSTDSHRSYAYYGGLGAGTTALFTLNYLALLPVQIAANVFSGVVITMLVSLSMIQRGWR